MGWRDRLPEVRGRLVADEPLAPFTWFRVGGPADLLFLPADEADLAAFLQGLEVEIPVTVLGVGSNVIVRDRGIEGVVIRLTGRGFSEIDVDAAEARVVAGAGALDRSVARAAAAAGVAGLEFMTGIPGAVGGALSMNAGCYGRETGDALAVAWGVDRRGAAHAFPVDALGYGYRHSGAPPDIIWTGAVFHGRGDDPETLLGRMLEIEERRQTSQPIRERTGGSTFRNPPGDSAWRLVDAAGWRGKGLGGAQVSAMHANFMINTGAASAADLEALGEAVRADVARKFGVTLEWEIRRIGRP